MLQTNPTPQMNSWAFSIFWHLCFGELCGVRREIFVVPGVFASFAYKMEVCTGSCRLVLPRQCNVPAPAREKKSNGIQHQQKKKHKVCSLEVGESSAFMGEKVTHGFLKVAGQCAPLLRRDKTSTKFRTAKKQPKLAISSVLADFPFETLVSLKEPIYLSSVQNLLLSFFFGLECFCYSFLWTRNWAELSWLMMDLWSWSPCQAHHAIHSQWVPQWNSSAVTPMFGFLFSVYKWTKTKFVTWNWPQFSRLQIDGHGSSRASSYQDHRFGETWALCN